MCFTFGDDGLECIYLFLLPVELVRCSFVCRHMRDNMPRMAERIVKHFLKRLYYSSPHVRVPEPGEVLYQGPSYSDCNWVSGESDEGPEVTILAASYLRQHRDMMTPRVMLMGELTINHALTSCVDAFNVIVRNAEIEGRNSEDDEEKKQYRWNVCPPLTNPCSR